MTHVGADAQAGGGDGLRMRGGKSCDFIGVDCGHGLDFFVLGSELRGGVLGNRFQPRLDALAHGELVAAFVRRGAR